MMWASEGEICRATSGGGAKATIWEHDSGGFYWIVEVEESQYACDGTQPTLLDAKRTAEVEMDRAS